MNTEDDGFGARELAEGLVVHSVNGDGASDGDVSSRNLDPSPHT